MIRQLVRVDDLGRGSVMYIVTQCNELEARVGKMRIRPEFDGRDALKFRRAD